MAFQVATVICVFITFLLPAASLGNIQNQDNPYIFTHPIKTVAIIGAGAGGLQAVEALRDVGIHFRLFERDSIPGGVWHYTDEVPLRPSYRPVTSPAIGDYIPLLPQQGVNLPYEEIRDVSYNPFHRAHWAPRPVWKSLHSNAPAPSQQFASWPWLVNTPWEASQTRICRYIRSYASYLNVNSNDDNPETSYNTRVELAEKIGNKWRLTMTRLRPHGENATRIKWWSEDFDALLVANGRYNSPNVPNISGLANWADRWPSQIQHGREYRVPEPFINKTVLIVGISVSASEISRDVALVAKKLYQSVREKAPTNDTLKIPLYSRKVQMRRLPEGAIVIGEIDRFLHPTGPDMSRETILLKNGSTLTGIDHIIFATGFLYAFPFLPQFHNSTIHKERVDTQIKPIITDGSHVRSLHLDVFYIPDPTLAFINRDEIASDFVFGEYVSVAIAKVWAGLGSLPNIQEMWRRYEERVDSRGGYTSTFNYVYSPALYREFIAWINSEAVKHGGRQVDQPPAERSETLLYWGLVRFGLNAAIDLPSSSLSGEEEEGGEMVGWA